MSNLDHYRAHGPDALPPESLLALVLNHPDAGKALIEHFGSLQAISTAPFEALALAPCVGPKRAQRLHAAFALARRAAIPSTRARIERAAQAAEQFLPRLSLLRHEELHGLYVDRGARILRLAVISQGSGEATVFDPRIILRHALEVGASGIFVAHNHPSGDPEPSLEDLRATQRLGRAADAVGLRLLDHLIVAGDRWVSLAARGERWP